MDSNFGLRKAVRVNPRHLIGASDEEDEVISTVHREESHDVFSSKHIRFFGPIGIGSGAIPLREVLIGVGDRGGHDVQQDGALPNPISTTYYCHYAGHPLDAKQFEVLWNFDRFVKRECVADMDDKRTESIMTLWNRVRRPSTTFDKRTRKYQYENWTDLHFEAFFEEYCASKAAMAMVNPVGRDTVSEWMKLRPPRRLTAAEWQAFVAEVGNSWLASSNEDYAKIDKEFKELLGLDAIPGIERHCELAVEPSGARNRARSLHNPKGHRKARNKKTKGGGQNCRGKPHALKEEQSTGNPRGRNSNSTNSHGHGHIRQNKRRMFKRRLSHRQDRGRRSQKPSTTSPVTSAYGNHEADAYSGDGQGASDDSIDIII